MKYNPFYSLIYAFALHCHLRKGRPARYAKKIYDFLIKRCKGSVIVKTHTNGQGLYCNFSHKLPFYQKEFPLYDRQLSKLCYYIHKELNRRINIIDVGANVGDTVLNIGLNDAFYLCIEGNKSFAKLIQHNLKHRYNYVLEPFYLTDNLTEKNYRQEITNGTNRLLFSNNTSSEESVSIQTLDQLVEEKYKDKLFDLIKIDTDGFDFRVIRGAKKTIEKCHPLLFFEWDKAYCKEQGEDPISIFPILGDLGYSVCILFDNFGNLRDIVQTNDLQKLGDVIENTIGDGLPYYYDVLAINNNGKFSSKLIYNLF